MTRKVFSAIIQPVSDTSGDVATSDPAITQRGASAAAEVVGAEVALRGNQDGSLGGVTVGPLRRRARQWLGQFGKKNVHGGEMSLQAPQSATDKKASALKTSVLPEPRGLTVLTQASASAMVQASRRESGHRMEGSSRYFDAQLIRDLLCRVRPKTETFEQLSAAPVERALESILADEVISRMPANLLVPLGELSRVSAGVFEAAPKDRQLAWTRALCAILQQEYPLAWSVKAPILAVLCVGPDTESAKAEALVKFLQELPGGGFGALAAVAILRAMYLAADREGFASQTVPFISQANNHYINHMFGLTGRIYVDWGGKKPKHQGAGLTAYHAPSPIDASWMQPSTITCHLYQPNPACSRVVHDLAYGNPYGCGISGSTNIFLFAAAHFNAVGQTGIDLMAMTTAMGAILAYNGGHSFNEVYAAAQMYPDAASTSLSALNAYHPGHARGLFIDQVDPQQSWLAEASFKRLADFLVSQKSVASMSIA